jgi:hypothetical protein
MKRVWLSWLRDYYSDGKMKTTGKIQLVMGLN